MGEYTPGPWTRKNAEVWIPTKGLYNGVSAYGGTVANACLISAAPDLLEALQWMIKNDDTNEGDVPLPEHSGKSWNEINEYWIEGLNRARKAVAKATNKEPT